MPTVSPPVEYQYILIYDNVTRRRNLCTADMILPARRCARAVLAVTLCMYVCLCVCLSQVGVLSRRLNRSSGVFWLQVRGYSRLTLHCAGKKFGYLQK